MTVIRLGCPACDNHGIEVELLNFSKHPDGEYEVEWTINNAAGCFLSMDDLEAKYTDEISDDLINYIATEEEAEYDYSDHDDWREDRWS